MQKFKSKSVSKNTKFFTKIYDVVKQIPEGKVATYGQIARILKTKDARKIGWALHGNKDPKIPCHRVVSKDGKVAENYGSFLPRKPAQNHTSRRERTVLKSREGRLGGDGWREQKRKLTEEGISFIGERQVDLKKYLWET